jgi:hypothetical protein
MKFTNTVGLNMYAVCIRIDWLDQQICDKLFPLKIKIQN